jgi:hypothetical protein
MCYGLAAACRRVRAITDGSKERQAAIRAATETSLRQTSAGDMAAQGSVMARARDDFLANCRATCEQIDAETRRVLDLHERTAAISVAELYAAFAQQN